MQRKQVYEISMKRYEYRISIRVFHIYVFDEK